MRRQAASPQAGDPRVRLRRRLKEPGVPLDHQVLREVKDIRDHVENQENRDSRVTWGPEVSRDLRGL